VMHDGMQYDPIQCKGHEPFRVGNLGPDLQKILGKILSLS